MSATADFARKRQTMVECQIRTFDVTDQPLLQRFLDVPRETFVGADNQAAAYSDSLLTLKGEGREVELGAFLAEEERIALRDELQEHIARLN